MMTYVIGGLHQTVRCSLLQARAAVRAWEAGRSHKRPLWYVQGELTLVLT